MVSIDRVEPGCVIAAHVEAVDIQDWILDTMDGIGEKLVEQVFDSIVADVNEALANVHHRVDTDHRVDTVGPS